MNRTYDARSVMIHHNFLVAKHRPTPAGADRAGVREVRACLACQVAVELREAIACFCRAARLEAVGRLSLSCRSREVLLISWELGDDSAA
jgi:hypothetical protein